MYIVFAYFMETMVIGLIHMVKLWATGKYGKPNRLSSGMNSEGLTGWGGILFFAVHYFFFVFVQSVFVFAIFSIGGSQSMFAEPFSVIENYKMLLQHTEMQLTLGIIAATQMLSAVRYFFAPRLFEQYSFNELFFQPYLRIFIQQFATILAFGVFIVAGGGKAAALILIVIRHLIDCLLVAARHSETVKEALVKWLASSGKKNQPPPSAPEEISRSLDVFLQR